MAPRLYRLTESPTASIPDEDPLYQPPSLPLNSSSSSSTSSSSSEGNSFVDEEPLDKVVSSLVAARRTLVPPSATQAIASPPPRPRTKKKKRRLLAGVDADEEPSASDHSHTSSSSSGIPTPDVAVDADPEDSAHVKRHILTLMPHPVLHRYHGDEERDNYRERDQPSPPSPPLPVIDLVDSAMPPHADTNSDDLLQQDTTPTHSPHLQPRMTATDLDDLFDEDPNSPPPNGNAHNSDHDSTSPSQDKPPAEAMVEADAWRPAIQSEAKLAYDHFKMHQGMDAAYACAVMPVNTLLRVMEKVGEFMGAKHATAQGPTGLHVDLKRAADARELPQFEAFEAHVDKTLNEIIVRDVLETAERKRKEEEERQREQLRKKNREERERRRLQEERLEEEERQKRLAQQREEKRQNELARAKAEARARARLEASYISTPANRPKRVTPPNAIDVDEQTPPIIGPSVNYRSISASKPSRNRMPVISFDDDKSSDSPPPSPPPPRKASLLAEKVVASFSASAVVSSSSEDEAPPRPHTRMFALKQRRIFEKEKKKMLGVNADINELLRHSRIMRIRLAKLRKKRLLQQKYTPVFGSPGNSRESIVEIDPSILCEELEEDEIEKGPAPKRRRLHRAIDLSDDEVEEVEVQTTPPPRPPPKRPAMVTASFQPKPEVPSSYMKVMTGKTEDLEWGEMGDNFTVLGKRQQWELDDAPVAQTQKIPWSFKEYWDNEMQKASLQRVSTLAQRPPLPPKYGVAGDKPSMDVEGMMAEELEHQRARAEKRLAERGERRAAERAEQKRRRDALERERIAQQKQALYEKLQERREATSAARTRSKVGPSGHGESIGGGIKKNGKRMKAKMKAKSGKSGNGSSGGLSRSELRKLRKQEEDYREKEDPRHPEYVPRKQFSGRDQQEKKLAEELSLQQEGQERLLTRWEERTRSADNGARRAGSQEKREEGMARKHRGDSAHGRSTGEKVKQSTISGGAENDDHRAQWEAHQERLRRQREERVQLKGIREPGSETQPSWLTKAGGSKRTDGRRKRENGTGKRQNEEDASRDRGNRRDDFIAKEEPERRERTTRSSTARRGGPSRKGQIGERERYTQRGGDSLGREQQQQRQQQPPRSSRRRGGPESGYGGGKGDPLTAARIGSENKGFALLSKMGWKEGEGLGRGRAGRTSPVAPDRRGGRSGLGGWRW